MDNLFADFEKKLISNSEKIFNAPDSDNPEEHEQGSIGWHIARLGKATGSRAADIMSKGRGAGAIGAKFYSYVDELVSEKLLSEDGVYEYIKRISMGSTSTRWGTEHESWARDEFSKIMGFNIIETPFRDFEDLEDVGGSNDGEVIDSDGVWTEDIIEIKNPYDPKVHKDNILKCNSGTYTEKDPHYPQMQFNIMCAEAKGCYFISGDIRSKIPIGWVYVPRDDDYIDRLIERLKLLRELVNEQVQELLNLHKDDNS